MTLVFKELSAPNQNGIQSSIGIRFEVISDNFRSQNIIHIYVTGTVSSLSTLYLQIIYLLINRKRTGVHILELNILQ